MRRPRMDGHQDTEEEEAETAGGDRAGGAPERPIDHLGGHRDRRGPAAHVGPRHREVDGDPAGVHAARPWGDTGVSGPARGKVAGLPSGLGVLAGCARGCARWCRRRRRSRSPVSFCSTSTSRMLPGGDHGAEHVEQPHVLKHRHPDHEIGVGQRWGRPEEGSRRAGRSRPRAREARGGSDGTYSGGRSSAGAHGPQQLRAPARVGQGDRHPVTHGGVTRRSASSRNRDEVARG